MSGTRFTFCSTVFRDVYENHYERYTVHIYTNRIRYRIRCCLRHRIRCRIRFVYVFRTCTFRIRYRIRFIFSRETSVFSVGLPNRCPRLWLTCVPSAIAANRILVDSQTQRCSCDSHTITSTVMVNHPRCP